MQWSRSKWSRGGQNCQLPLRKMPRQSASPFPLFTFGYSFGHAESQVAHLQSRAGKAPSPTAAKQTELRPISVAAGQSSSFRFRRFPAPPILVLLRLGPAAQPQVCRRRASTTEYSPQLSKPVCFACFFSRLVLQMKSYVLLRRLRFRFPGFPLLRVLDLNPRLIAYIDGCNVQFPTEPYIIPFVVAASLEVGSAEYGFFYCLHPFGFSEAQ